MSDFDTFMQSGFNAVDDVMGDAFTLSTHAGDTFKGIFDQAQMDLDMGLAGYNQRITDICEVSKSVMDDTATGAPAEHATLTKGGIAYAVLEVTEDGSTYTLKLERKTKR